MWAMSLRHAASYAAVRLALLMGGRGGSAADIVLIAPGPSRSVGRMLSNCYVVGRRCRMSSSKLNRNKSCYRMLSIRAAVYVRVRPCFWLLLLLLLWRRPWLCCCCCGGGGCGCGGGGYCCFGGCYGCCCRHHRRRRRCCLRWWCTTAGPAQCFVFNPHPPAKY